MTKLKSGRLVNYKRRFVLKYGPNPAIFLFYFRPFLNTLIDIGSLRFDYESVDGVVGI